jgi:hypothetical protein
MLFYLPSWHTKEGAMKNGAVRQQQLFQTDVEVQSNLLSTPVPIHSELIVLLAQLMKSVVDAIESEANDEQDHR